MSKHRFLFILSVLTVTALTSAAQSGISQLFISTGSDEFHLIDGYSTPLFKAIGANLLNGWSNTATINDHFTFDLRFNVSVTAIPNADKTFDVSNIGLSTLVPADPNKTISPTIGGGTTTAGALYNLNNNGKLVDQFTLPKGQASSVQTEQVQLTFGITKNTDIIIRGMPSVDMGDDFGKYSMIGFGLKHNILKDIMDNDQEYIPFKLSVLFGYTHLTLNMPLNVQPISNIPIASFAGNQSVNFSNQYLEGEFNSYVAQVIMSDKIAFVTPFLAIGYNATNYNVNAIGNYPYLFYESQYYYLPLRSGIFNKSAFSVDALGVNLGFQLNFNRFRIAASYSISDLQGSVSYNTFTGSGSVIF